MKHFKLCSLTLATLLGVTTFSNPIFAMEVAKNSAIMEQVQADDSIDSWMPDKNLQKTVANLLGVNVSDLTQSLIQDYTPDTFFELSLNGVTNFKGLELFNDAFKAYVEPTLSGLDNQSVVDFSSFPFSSSLDIYDSPNLTDPSGIKTDGSVNVAIYPQVKNKQDLHDSNNWENIRDRVSKTNISLDETNYESFSIPISPLYNINNSLAQFLQYDGRYSLHAKQGDSSNTLSFTTASGELMEYSYSFDNETQPTRINFKLIDSSKDYNSIGKSASQNSRFLFSDIALNVPFNDTVRSYFYNKLIEIQLNFKDVTVNGAVTVKYVDTDGNKISDDVVKSGNVGEEFTTEQKSIAGYTFKEVQGNPTGTFTDQVQTVTYVYTKDIVNPSPKPGKDSKSAEKSSTISEPLPQTGDDNFKSFVGVLLGAVFLITTAIASVIRFKKYK